MSINRVELSHTTSQQLPFELREGEVLTYRSLSDRQSFSVSSREAKGPVKVNISVTSGHVFVTSRRFIYIGTGGDVESFSFEFSNVSICHFSHALKTPWFGPNYWSFMFYSPDGTTCDGFPRNEWFQGQISFKDGGLFEFVKSVDVSINDGLNNTHIDDELPRYTAT